MDLLGDIKKAVTHPIDTLIDGVHAGEKALADEAHSLLDAGLKVEQTIANTVTSLPALALDAGKALYDKVADNLHYFADKISFTKSALLDFIPGGGLAKDAIQIGVNLYKIPRTGDVVQKNEGKSVTSELVRGGVGSELNKFQDDAAQKKLFNVAAPSQWQTVLEANAILDREAKASHDKTALPKANVGQDGSIQFTRAAHDMPAKSSDATTTQQSDLKVQGDWEIKQEDHGLSTWRNKVTGEILVKKDDQVILSQNKDERMGSLGNYKIGFEGQNFVIKDKNGNMLMNDSILSADQTITTFVNSVGYQQNNHESVGDHLKELLGGHNLIKKYDDGVAMMDKDGDKIVVQFTQAGPVISVVRENTILTRLANGQYKAEDENGKTQILDDDQVGRMDRRTFTTALKIIKRLKGDGCLDLENGLHADLTDTEVKVTVAQDNVINNQITNRLNSSLGINTAVVGLFGELAKQQGDNSSPNGDKRKPGDATIIIGQNQDTVIERREGDAKGQKPTDNPDHDPSVTSVQTIRRDDTIKVQVGDESAVVNLKDRQHPSIDFSNGSKITPEKMIAPNGDVIQRDGTINFSDGSVMSSDGHYAPSGGREATNSGITAQQANQVAQSAIATAESIAARISSGRVSMSDIIALQNELINVSSLLANISAMPQVDLGAVALLSNAEQSVEAALGKAQSSFTQHTSARAMSSNYYDQAGRQPVSFLNYRGAADLALTA